MRTVLTLLAVGLCCFAQDANRRIPPPMPVFHSPDGYDLAPQVAFFTAHSAFRREVYFKGQHEGLLKYLADDAVIFQPKLVIAQEFRKELPRPENQTVTVIQTGYSHGAGSGDMGVTSDKFEVFDKTSGESIGDGYWLTIWKKNGTDWKIALSCIWKTPPGMGPRSTEHLVPFRPAKGRTFPVSPDEIQALENQFSKLSSDRGPAEAYAFYGASNAMMQRTQAYPIFGPNAIRSSYAGQPYVKWTWRGVAISQAGDFAYVYGDQVDGTGKSGSYIRIWKRDSGGEWKVVMDVATTESNVS